ncbi:hypothetical protein LLE79_09460 [Staphylococcus epidermidis]|nr:hypothetical protein [Staphylococcus epidermidis]MCC3700496.1 hypothetical protein [Staphylococcus epidermidis]
MEKDDDFVKSIFTSSKAIKDKANKDINFSIKLIILDSETKAIRFDTKPNESININAKLPDNTTLKSLLLEEIELQRYDFEGKDKNFDEEKEKFLKDFDESYDGKVSRELDEKSFGKVPWYKKLSNTLFKENKKKDKQIQYPQSHVRDVFREDTDVSKNKKEENPIISQNTESDEKLEDEINANESKEESNEETDNIEESEDTEEETDNLEDNKGFKNNEPERESTQNTSESINDNSNFYQLPLKIPEYKEQKPTMRHSDDPFEQKQNEYIYDRLLNKESYKSSLYEELGHRLEYQFVVYVGNKKKHIDEIVASNEMTQEEFDNQTQEITNSIQQDTEQQINQFETTQQENLEQFTNQQDKDLNRFKDKQQDDLKQYQSDLYRDKQDYLKKVNEEQEMRISNEQIRLVESNNHRLNNIVAQEEQEYDFKIKEALNEDCKQLIDEIDEKLFEFDDKTYRQLLHKRETWKEEIRQAKQLEIQEEQAKNEKLKIQKHIKDQEAIIAQQKQEEQEIERIKEEKEKLAEKKKESELQLELARTKNEKERLAQEDRRISDSEKQTSLREQELFQAKQKSSNFNEVLMAQVMNSNKKETPTSQLPEPSKSSKKTNQTNTNESSIMKTIGIFLISAVVLIGIFLGGFFADHYFHFLNCLPITTNHLQLIEPPFQLLK